MSADSYADLLERLFAMSEDRHSLAVIEAVVAEARTELAGQTPPGAQLELLERLARQRLTDGPPSRPAHGEDRGEANPSEQVAPSPQADPPTE